jgi:hypothetical protein
MATLEYRTTMSVHKTAISTGIFLVSFFIASSNMKGKQANSGVDHEHFNILACYQLSYYSTIHQVSKEGIIKQKTNELSIIIKQQTYNLCIYTDYTTVKH